jgi:cystathionine beta-lyase family protein involved in aluminum resistance
MYLTPALRSKFLMGMSMAMIGVGTISCQQGPELAKLIVAGRPYQSVDQLVGVKGIGEQSLEKLRPYVKVDGETEQLREAHWLIIPGK